VADGKEPAAAVFGPKFTVFQPRCQRILCGTILTGNKANAGTGDGVIE
jgi:hypothetical protein